MIKNRSAYGQWIPEFVGISFISLLILIEFVAIMILNDGHFVYTLDDPYIHLALAEYIMNGHYGINLHEYSAPSSSIVWPFILAPVATWAYSPFIINILAAIMTVTIYIRILKLSISFTGSRQQLLIVTALAISLVFATNLVGLVFIGMEHSLQVLVVSAIAYGLLLEIKVKSVSGWLLFCIVLAPLVRYENLCVSITALGYLMIRSHVKASTITTGVMVMLIGLFSLFLTSLGLDILPSSIQAKSVIPNYISGQGGLIEKIKILLTRPNSTQPGVLLTAVFILFSYTLFSHKIAHRQLAFASIAAIAAHFIGGQFGSYNRYEIYILAFSLLIIIYLSTSTITQRIHDQFARAFQVALLSVCLGIYIGFPYLVTLVSLPLASNNIYEQQYQMHRFAVDYYRKPVAVNDIGYVSYQNNNFVLDLWGLASATTLKQRLSNTNPNWLGDVVREHDIKLVMIYDEWFDAIPNDWTKLGALALSRRKITPASNTVSFYSTADDENDAVNQALNAFVTTLPVGVTFTFEHP